MKQNYLGDISLFEEREKKNAISFSVFSYPMFINDLLILAALTVMTLTPVYHLKFYLETMYRMIQVTSIFMIIYGLWMISISMSLEKVEGNSKKQILFSSVFQILVSLYFILIPINTIIGYVALIIMVACHILLIVDLKKKYISGNIFNSGHSNILSILSLIFDIVLVGTLVILTLTPTYHLKSLLPLTYAVIQYISIILSLISLLMLCYSIFKKEKIRIIANLLQIIGSLYLLLIPINTIIGFFIFAIMIILQILAFWFIKK